MPKATRKGSTMTKVQIRRIAKLEAAGFRDEDHPATKWGVWAVPDDRHLFVEPKEDGTFHMWNTCNSEYDSITYAEAHRIAKANGWHFINYLAGIPVRQIKQ